MRVTSVEIHPAGSSNIAVLSFRDPKRANPFNVKNIVGLDADEIVPRYYGVSGDSISKFYNLSLEKREIVVQIELNPDFSANESYSDLRDQMYKMISSSRTGIVWVNFKDGEDSVAAISGFVKKFEAVHFEKTPQVQITISCQDPMLKALVPVAVNVAALNPASTIVQDLLSTAPHGFTFEMEILADLASFVIHDDDETWTFTVTPVDGFDDGDVLHFSSEHNNKYLYLTRGVETIHLADVIESGSVWPILFPGDNELFCENPASLDWVAISHYPTYWGI